MANETTRYEVTARTIAAGVGEARAYYDRDAILPGDIPDEEIARLLRRGLIKQVSATPAEPPAEQTTPPPPAKVPPAAKK